MNGLENLSSSITWKCLYRISITSWNVEFTIKIIWAWGFLYGNVLNNKFNFINQVLTVHALYLSLCCCCFSRWRRNVTVNSFLLLYPRGGQQNPFYSNNSSGHPYSRQGNTTHETTRRKLFSGRGEKKAKDQTEIMAFEFFIIY